MPTTKTYPRAKVSRHPVLDGWTVDLILRNGAKPIKVNATYSTIGHAHRSALTKLGVKVPATTAVRDPRHPEPTLAPAKPKGPQARPAGKCIPCGRPMRHCNTLASDHPGTVLRQREGLCQTCSSKAKKPAV